MVTNTKGWYAFKHATLLKRKIFKYKNILTFFQKPIDNQDKSCYNVMVSDKDVSKDSRFP